MNCDYNNTKDDNIYTTINKIIDSLDKLNQYIINPHSLYVKTKKIEAVKNSAINEKKELVEILKLLINSLSSTPPPVMK